MEGFSPGLTVMAVHGEMGIFSSALMMERNMFPRWFNCSCAACSLSTMPLIPFPAPGSYSYMTTIKVTLYDVEVKS